MSSFTGTIYEIGKTQTFGQKGFKKRTLILTDDDDRYPNYIPFDFVRDDVDLLDSLTVDTTVTVEYQLKGRQWQKSKNDPVRYFPSMEAISVTELSDGDSGGDQPEDDDVPF